MNAAYNGQWARRGLIHVPVVDEPVRELCSVCGCVSPVGLCRPCRDSARVRVHGSHAGFAQHKRRNELPCQECSVAEKVYQGKRYRRGSLSKRDFEWAEKAAVKGSWVLDSKLNRR
jgi:hypothetical protein